MWSIIQCKDSIFVFLYFSSVQYLVFNTLECVSFLKLFTEVTEPSEIRLEAVVIKTQRAKITSVVQVKKTTVGCLRP